MELSEVLLKRRSVRKFTAEPVSEEEIDALMHAAMSGPSAVNRQPWEFYAVTDPEKLEALRGTSAFSKMQAPLAVIVCGSKLRGLPMEMSEFWVQDCSAATENILLRAVDLGLGAVWCGVWPVKSSAEKVKKALSLPGTVTPLNILWIGHPAETPEAGDHYDYKRIHRL